MSSAITGCLQAWSASRPQPRVSQTCCRAQHGNNSQSQPQQQLPQLSRRSALLLPAVAAAAAAVFPRAALAEEAAAVSATEPLTLEAVPATAVDLDVASWPKWIDRNFSFSYPPGLVEVQDLTYAAPTRRAGSDQVMENALKAEVLSEDGQQRINVVVSQAAAIKRTLTQATDISQLGDARAVARLLLPPGATVVEASAEVVVQPPRNTGTVLGIIQRDPVNYYSYEVILPNKTHLQMAAAVLLGRVYLLGATVPEEQWQQCGPALKEVARSFRLRYRA